MNKYKKGILFIFVLFFFVFSTQQASAFNPKSLFKLFTKIIDDIPVSNKPFKKPPIFEPSPNLYPFHTIRVYSQYCSKSENKNKGFCLQPNRYCKSNQSSYPCPLYLKEIRNKSEANKITLYCLRSNNTVYTIYAIRCSGSDTSISYDRYKKITSPKKPSSGGFNFGFIIFIVIIIVVVYFIFRKTEDGRKNNDQEKINIITKRSSGTVEKRLKDLKKLYEDGWIDKDDYTKRKEEILKDL